jgi:hypothetical protein
VIDLSDIFGAPAPPKREPWPFKMRGPGHRVLTVVPLRRVGDPVDPEGEHVLLRVVEGDGMVGATFRSPLRGGPAYRERVEGDGVGSCDLAPHVLEVLGIIGGPVD